MQNKDSLQIVMKNCIIVRVGSAVRHKMQDPKLVHNKGKSIQIYLSSAPLLMEY